jgi:HlyD family secretion protein
MAVALVRALLPDPLLVEMGTVSRGAMRVTVDETGRTRVKTRYLISSPLAGRVGRIVLRPGDQVAEGTTAAEVAPGPSPLLDARSRAEAQARLAGARFTEQQSHATLSRANTAVEQARREADRAGALGAAGAITAAAVDEATFALQARSDELAAAQFAARVADEELRRAQVVLAPGARPPSTRELHPVRSPVAGVVLRVLQESEAVIPAGVPLLEVGDPTALEVVVDVLTADAVAITAGAPVTIEAGGGLAPLTGRVRRVEPAAFTRLSALGVEEQRVNVLVDLNGPAARWATLGDGFRVESRILTWQTAQAVLVPAAAAIRSGEGWAVFVVQEGRARRRPIVIGHRNPEQLEALSGIDPGERLVLYPGDRLTEGKAVRARPVP